jgi:micrococcal nuclease
MKPFLLLALLLAGCGGRSGTARVERVVDGDTIVVRLDGRSERVRYIGVDTPESVKPGVRVQCFAKSAAKENRRLVLGQAVRLEYDAEARDRYGRLLAYVWRGDLLVNAELVRLGYGKPLEIAPNLAHAAELRQLAAAAKRGRRGLWSRC